MALPSLTELLSRWEEAYRNGQDLSVAELCADQPEMAVQLASCIDALRKTNTLLLTRAEVHEQITTDGRFATTLQPSNSPVPAVSPSLAIIPGYEVLAELGRGGMGLVYKARQVNLDRVVAVKVLLHADHAGSESFARFRAEAKALARLHHVGIVAVYEVGDVDGLPFFSMEFCPGGGLDKRLAGTPMSPNEAATVVRQLTVAVQAAHEAKVLHRDLKPANVLLAEDGTLKVTDFGLAKCLDELGQTQSGTVMGTPNYMAPEQARGEKDVGVAVDTYSLGAILYECLTGRPPFRAATIIETLAQVLTQEPAPPRTLNAAVPRELEIICLKCLEKDPANRYMSARALGEDLGRWLDGEAIAARPVGWSDHLVRAVARNRLDSSFRPLARFWFLFGGIVLVGCLAEAGVRLGGVPSWLQTLISRTTIVSLGAVVVASCFGLRSAFQRQMMFSVCGLFVVRYFVYWMVYATPFPPHGTNTIPLGMMVSSFMFFFLGTTHSGMFYLFSLAFLGLGLALHYFPSLEVSLIVSGLAWGTTGTIVGLYLRRL